MVEHYEISWLEAFWRAHEVNILIAILSLGLIVFLVVIIFRNRKKGQT